MGNSIPMSHGISINRFESLTDHELASDIFHKLGALDWRGAALRLTDLAYIEERCRRGQVTELLQDYQRALIIGGIRVPGFTAGFEDEREVHPFVQQLTEFANLVQRREKSQEPGGAAAAGLSCPVLSSGAVDKHRQDRRDHKRPDAALRRRLLETAQWFRENLVGLQAYGIQPSYCAQEAFNWSRDGKLRRQAHRSLIDRRGSRSYLITDRRISVDKPQLSLHGKLYRHQSPIRCAVVSPDASVALTGGDDRRICMWDLKTGALTREFIDVPDRVFSMSISADGRRLVTGLADGSLAFWCLRTSRMLHHRCGHEGIAHAVAASADGARILSGGEDGSVILWDGQTAEILHRDQDLGPGPVRAIGISADGTIGLIGHQVNVERKRFDTLRVFRANAAQRFEMLHAETINKSVAVSPDGSLGISTGHHNKTQHGRLYGWDLRQAKQFWESVEQPCAIEAIAMTMDARGVLFLRADGVLARWDIALRQCTHRAQLGESAADVIACSATGHVAVTVDGFPGTGAHVWDLSTLPGFDNSPDSSPQILDLALLRGGKQAVTCNDQGLLSLWGRKRVIRERRINCDAKPWLSLLVDDAQRRVLVKDHGKRRYDVFDSGLKSQLTGMGDDEEPFTDLAATSTFNHLVSGHVNGALRFRCLQEATPPREQDWHCGSIKRIDALPGDRFVISIGEDHALRRWDLDTTNCCMTTPLHHQEEGAGISIDGQYVITRTHDFIYFRHLFRAGVPISFPCPSGRNNWITLAPDGRAFVAEEKTGDGCTNLTSWDLLKQRRLRTLASHRLGFSHRQISSDGRFLVVADYDHFLRVIELKTGNLLCIHQMHTPFPSIAGPLADGTIAIGTRRGPVRYLRICEAAQSVPFVTGAYEWHQPAKGAGRWGNQPTLRCPWCNRQGVVPLRTLQSMRSVNCNNTNLAHEVGVFGISEGAWDNARLRTKCPHCRRLLRLNPFLIDHRGSALDETASRGGEAHLTRRTCMRPHKTTDRRSAETEIAKLKILLHTGRVADLCRIIQRLDKTSWFDWPEGDNKARCEVCGSVKAESGLWLGKKRICTDCARNCFDALGDSLHVRAWRAAQVTDALSLASPLHARLAVLRRFSEVWRQADQWTTAERNAVSGELIRNLGYQGDVFGVLVRELAVDGCSLVGEALLSQLLAAWKPDPWRHLVNSAIVAMRIAPESFDVHGRMNEMLHDPRPSVREYLCVALGKHEAPWTRWFLQKLARDPEAAVRDEALWVLDRWEKKAGILRDEDIASRERLESFLVSGDPVLRKSAVMSLANMRCTWSRLRLLRAFSEEGDPIRSDIAWYVANPYRLESTEDQRKVFAAAGQFDRPRIERRAAEETDRVWGPILESLRQEKQPD